jgi:hypothetical protein
MPLRCHLSVSSRDFAVQFPKNFQAKTVVGNFFGLNTWRVLSGKPRMSGNSKNRNSSSTSFLPAKSWRHFVAGGYASIRSSYSFAVTVYTHTCFSRLGGMCGAIITSPFDVVKTRLQSSLFREKHMAMGVLSNGSGAAGGAVVVPRQAGGIFWHFIETGHIIRFVSLVSELRVS